MMSMEIPRIITIKQALTPDAVSVANGRLRVELSKKTARKAKAFTAPVDNQVTKDLEWEPPEEKK